MTFPEFEEKFRELWYQDQMPMDIEVDWLPEKRPAQIYEEFLMYLYIVSSVPQPRVLEIGVKDGNTRRFYEDLLGARYIGIDINPDSPADIHGDSRDEKTREQAESMFEEGRVDILFIDGNHSEDHAAKDYDEYCELVDCFGFIGIHDIHHDHAEYCHGAAVLWKKLVARGPSIRLWDIYKEVDYTPWAAGKGIRKQCGIGLVQLGIV